MPSERDDLNLIFSGLLRSLALADSVGTSVTMLDMFYLKPLKVEMRVEELLL